MTTVNKTEKLSRLNETFLRSISFEICYFRIKNTKHSDLFIKTKLGVPEKNWGEVARS